MTVVRDAARDDRYPAPNGSGAGSMTAEPGPSGCARPAQLRIIV